ncbi:MULTISPECIES: hypothetical protein [unclassified Streptomyces]|nr:MULTISPECIES: hypothetical protein [unclassified Streptomyces]WSA97545.1 hypothetical protein OIE63_37135 [Streptomyces sp. NBC_01795]WSB81972.1 hypothetical protein OHB04_38250 [Streptomyces sp. NBC_01775]WSS10815.1 hypothetical protein OG533_02005 [Streptomyces sp. NBC_01186]WSS46669.1 hypothetical protein OG220_02045 [Streptomyces sp. NBC_01187]
MHPRPVELPASARHPPGEDPPGALAPAGHEPARRSSRWRWQRRWR